MKLTESQKIIKALREFEEIEEVDDTELWVNGKIYWSGNRKDVDDNLLLDIADMAGEEDGTVYDIEDVEVVDADE